MINACRHLFDLSRTNIVEPEYCPPNDIFSFLDDDSSDDEAEQFISISEKIKFSLFIFTVWNSVSGLRCFLEKSGYSNLALNLTLSVHQFATLLLKGWNAHPICSWVSKGLNFRSIRHFKFTLISTMLLDVITLVFLRRFNLIGFPGTYRGLSHCISHQLYFINSRVSVINEKIQTSSSTQDQQFYLRTRKYYSVAFHCLIGLVESLAFPILFKQSDSINIPYLIIGLVSGYFTGRAWTEFDSAKFGSDEAANKARAKYIFERFSLLALIKFYLNRDQHLIAIFIQTGFEIQSLYSIGKTAGYLE